MEKSIDDLILDLKDSDDFVREEAIGMLWKNLLMILY